MTKKAEKLLAKMRRSNKNWKRKDLDTLYKGYGFVIDTTRKRHDKVYHPKYPYLVSGIPRHTVLGEWVIDMAVSLVDKFLQLEAES